MAWEGYIPENRTYVPELSVTRGGALGINCEAIQRYGLAKTPFMLLFFDRETQRIGLRKLRTAEKPEAVKLRIRNGSGSIRAKRFLDRFEIQYTKNRKMPLRFDEADALLVADLKEAR